MNIKATRKMYTIIAFTIVFTLVGIGCATATEERHMDLPDNTFLPFNEKGQLIWNSDNIEYVVVSFYSHQNMYAYADVEGFFNLLNSVTKEFVNYEIFDSIVDSFAISVFSSYGININDAIYSVSLNSYDIDCYFNNQLRAFNFVKSNDSHIGYIISMLWTDVYPISFSLFRINSDDFRYIQNFLNSLEKQNLH